MHTIQWTLGLACVVGLAGCASNPPTGNPGGRGDPYATTPADVRGREVSSVTLLEFSDQVGEALASRLPQVPAIQRSATKVLLELGDIKNATVGRGTSTQDFEIIRRKIFLKLVNNQQITNLAQINERPSRVDSQRGSLATEQAPDLLDEGTGSGGVGSSARYALRDTYLLDGTFGEIRREGTSTYIFDVTLTNAESRQIVFADQFEARQVR